MTRLDKDKVYTAKYDDMEKMLQDAIKLERARILADLEKLPHQGTWQDGTAIFWRADEVRKVVAGDEGD